MSLSNYYKSVEMEADMLVPDWREQSKTQLANGYCDADESGDIQMRDGYLYALMCKYWYMISYFYVHNRFMKYEVEDFVSWLIEALLLGLKYRRWRDPNFEVSKSEKGAEKVFNRCFFSIRNRYIKEINRDKSKTFYVAISLDTVIEDEVSLIDIVEDKTSYYELESFFLSLERDDVVYSMISENKYLDAVLAYMILSDSNITKSMLYEKLRHITVEDVTQFEQTYDCKIDFDLISRLKNMSTRGVKCLITLKLKDLRKKLCC